VITTCFQVGSDIISILKTLSELDKDFAVFLCGLEAKQTISRLQEKHSTVTVSGVEITSLFSTLARKDA